MLAQAVLSTLLFSMAASAANVALYWGQGNYGSLADTCNDESAEIIILSFLYEFGSGTNKLDFSGICSTTFDDGLLHCPTIGDDIKTCQGLGKKVLLSLGGASGAYGFDSDAAGEEFATTLWNMFGNGDLTGERPFDDAVLDGFDFDIETNVQTGYAACANKLKSYYDDDSSKNYYISAAPQCPYPDASVGNLMENAHIDFAFIQFYNNYCSTLGSNFNWDTWVNYAENVSPNKDVKLYLGLPASASAAGSGYATPDEVKSTVSSILSSDGADYFGGIMLWDAYWSNLNQINGESFANNMQDILNDVDAASSATTSTQATTTSTTSTTSTQATTTSTQATTTSTQATTTSSTSTTESSTQAATTSDAQETTEEPTTTSTPAPVTTSDTLSLDIPTTIGKAAGTTEADAPTTTQGAVPTTSTTNTQTATPTTMATVTTSPSTTTSAAPAATAGTDCSSLSGLAKAQCMNANFKAGLYLGDANACSTEGALACSADGAFAICNFGKWINMPCSAGTTCFAYNFGDQIEIGCDYTSNEAKYQKRDGGLLNLLKRNLGGHVHHAH